MVGEQGLLQQPGSRPPRRVIFQPQGLEPPAFSEGIEPEELWLGKRGRALEENGPRERPRFAGAVRELHLVAAERLAGVLYGERLLPQPERRLPAGQALLAVDFPPPPDGVAQGFSTLTKRSEKKARSSCSPLCTAPGTHESTSPGERRPSDRSLCAQCFCALKPSTHLAWAATSSAQLSAFAKCQSAILLWTLNTVSG